MLNLIAATMGAGTITMPYIVCRAGIGLGAILTVLGALLSHYTGMLLVSDRMHFRRSSSSGCRNFSCVVDADAISFFRSIALR